MKQLILKTAYVLISVGLLSFTSLTYAEHWHGGHGGGWHHHGGGGWNHGGIYFNFGVGPAYYDDAYAYPYNPGYRCGWVPGHWYNGYWVHSHRACYYY